MVFTFVFDRKYPFWANLVEIVNIVNLSQNLASRLIRICRIQCYCSLFLILTGNTLFWANLFQKIKIISLNWNLVPRLIRIWRIQWWCSLFLFLTRNTLLGGKFRPKSQNFQFKVGLSPSKRKCVICFIENPLNMRKMLFVWS